MRRHTARENGTAPRPAAADAWLPWVAIAALLGCFLALVEGGYFIRAFSDCHNWLDYARHFGREFTHSRWPYGYPLFLRAALGVLGPCRVFLANLPVMLALFWVVSWVGTLFGRSVRHAGRTDAALPFPWAFLAAWTVVLASDAPSFTRYLNPYRDPLSYLLLMASVGLFVRSLAARAPRRRVWGVAVSGAVLGLASSVREPSLLAAGPMALYGFLAWRAGQRGEGVRIPFFGTVSAFGAGLAVALSPLLVQTYLTTHQVLLPPQASLEAAVVPGSHFDWTTFRQVGRDAWTHYARHEPWLLLLGAAGVLAALVRRDRLALALVLPAAAGYALFYSFYWTFVVRYYYVSVLFLALLAGYALQSFSVLLAIRFPRHGRMAGRLLLLLAACAAAGHLLHVRSAEAAPLHRPPQAEAMAGEFRALCPDASHIYAPRYLCDWIDWFVSCPSSPLPVGGEETDGETAFSILRENIAPRLARGDILYAAVWNGARGQEPDEPVLRRTFDRLPVGTVDADRHHARDYARGWIWLYRIAPWSACRTALDWPVPAAGPHGSAYWYMLDTGDWSATESDPATIAVEGTPLPDPIPHGGAWVGGVGPALPGGTAPRTVSAHVSASHPLPREMPLRTGRLDEPLEIDFTLYSTFDHLWRWSGDILPRHPRWHHGIRVLGSAEVTIPVPCPGSAGTILEWEFLSSRKDPSANIPVSAWEGDCCLFSTLLPGDRNLVKLATPLPPAPERSERFLRVEVEPRPHSGDPDGLPVAVEFYRVSIHRWPAAYPVEMRIGAPGDAIHASAGFHPPEGRGGGTYRWTAGPAEIAVYPPVADVPVVLRIAYSTESIPAGINPDGTLRVSWDGTELHGQAIPGDTPGDWVWQGALPSGELDGCTPHRITLDAPLWRPADYGSRDSRTLGVRVRCVTLLHAPERQRLDRE